MPAAGFGLLVACAMKATTILYLPIYLAILYTMPRRATESQRWNDLGLFLAGFTAPLAVLVLGCYAVASAETLLWLRDTRRFLNIIGEFLAPASLYKIIHFPFGHSLSPVLNLWALGPWLAILAWRVKNLDESDFDLRRLLATSAMWCGLYFILMLSLNYFPSRYALHILLPMAILTTVGIALVQRTGLERIVQSLGQSKGRRADALLVLLSLPSAALFAPLIAWSAGWFGVDSQRLMAKLICLLLSLLSIAAPIHRWRRDLQVLSFLVIFPIAAAMIWTASASFGRSDSFWPMPAGPNPFGGYLINMILGLGVSGVLVFSSLRRFVESSLAITGCAILYFMVLLIKDGPRYLSPSYSMKEASRDMGSVLAGYSSIVSVRAETLFIENRLRYRSSARRGWSSNPPQILVVAASATTEKNLIEQAYRVLKSYRIHVAPEYHRRNPDLSGTSVEGVEVLIYKRNVE